MSKIRIKNFGPIKDGFDTEDGFMDIKKVTVFIGDQGTGKSTVAKLISTFYWVEKTMYRATMGNAQAETFVEAFWAYQGLNNYFNIDTVIEYVGEVYSFLYENGNLKAKSSENTYPVPKLMYVPADRNFLSVVIEADKVKGLPKPLYTFLEEFVIAQEQLDGQLKLPIGQFKFEYNPFRRLGYIVGDNYDINLLEASSGLQALVPLFLVSRNLALSINKKEDLSKSELNLYQGRILKRELESILLNEELSEELRSEAIKLLSSKFQNARFINIVEEPEQNLFPTSQRHILNSLLEFANMTEGNKLIMTTHSPYILSYLSLAVQGGTVLKKINGSDKVEEMTQRLETVVPMKSVISGDDLVVYQLKDDGSISLLPNYEGIPADSNFLNKSLMESNQLFDALLDIEEDL